MKILKHSLIILAPFLLIAIHNQSASALQDDGNQTEWQRFQVSDLPKTIADLKPTETVPDEDNAAWWLAKAEAGRLAIDIKLAEKFDLDSKCSEEFVEEYKQIVAEHPETYEWLLKAAETSHFQVDLDYSVKTYADFASRFDVNDMRSVARVLMYRASVELSQGHADRAAESALAMLKLSRHDNLGFGMTGHLVRKTISSMGLASLNQILQSKKALTPELTQKIRDELERHDTLDDFQRCFDSERVIGLQLQRDQSLAMAIFQTEGYLKTINAIQQNANKTIAEQAELLDDQTSHTIMTGLIYPGVQMSRSTANRVLTQVRCLRLLVELNDQTEIEPSLEVIDLPLSAVTDPISGDPLRFRKVENGWLVYGVGRNHLDDGGDISMDLDYGFTSVVEGK